MWGPGAHLARPRPLCGFAGLGHCPDCRCAGSTRKLGPRLLSKAVGHCRVCSPHIGVGPAHRAHRALVRVTRGRQAGATIPLEEVDDLGRPATRRPSINMDRTWRTTDDATHRRRRRRAAGSRRDEWAATYRMAPRCASTWNVPQFYSAKRCEARTRAGLSAARHMRTAECATHRAKIWRRNSRPLFGRSATSSCCSGRARVAYNGPRGPRAARATTTGTMQSAAAAVAWRLQPPDEEATGRSRSAGHGEQSCAGERPRGV